MNIMNPLTAEQDVLRTELAPGLFQNVRHNIAQGAGGIRLFEVAEACLSHVAGSTVSRAYQRSDYFVARRSVMADWSTFISDCARRADFLTEILEPVLKGDPSP